MADPTSTTSSTQREGYTVSQTILPKGVLADLQAKQKSFQGLSADLQAQLSELTQGTIADISTMNTAVDESAKARTEQINAKAGIDTAIVQNKENILHTFGIDINNDPDNLVAQSVQTIRAAHAARTDLADQISQLQGGANPVTNPLMWFVNNVKATPLIQQHNALLRKENSAINDLHTAQELAANQTALQPAAITDKINAQRIADVNATIADAQIKKLELTGAARAKVAQNLIEASHLAKEDLTAAFSLADLQKQHISTTFSDTDKTSQKTKDEQNFLSPINAAIAQYGLKPFENVYMFNRLDKKTQDTLIKWTQFGRAGATPGESVAALNDILGGTNLGAVAKDAPDAAGLMRTVVDNGYKTLEGAQANAMMSSKAKEQLKNAKGPVEQLAVGVNIWASKQMDDAFKRNNMADLDKDNPYQLNYTRVATDSALADNPIAAAINTKPAGSTVDDNFILSIAEADVANKKMDVGTASKAVADFYAKGIQRQRATTAMTTLGFPPKDDYPVQAKLHFFGSSTNIDMTNPLAVENFLIHQSASGLAANVSPKGLMR